MSIYADIGIVINGVGRLKSPKYDQEAIISGLTKSILFECSENSKLIEIPGSRNISLCSFSISNFLIRDV